MKFFCDNLSHNLYIKCYGLRLEARMPAHYYGRFRLESRLKICNSDVLHLVSPVSVNRYVNGAMAASFNIPSPYSYVIYAA